MTLPPGRSVRHLLVAEAEEVSELVDDGLLNLGHDLGPGAGNPEDGPAENHDLIGQRGKLSPGQVRARDASENTEELVLVGSVSQVEIVLIGLVRDHDRNVLQQVGELGRQLVESFRDERFEFGWRDVEARHEK